MTAKIKLNAASGGGSFSLQAPSSSSNNRVFTIPDVADGTIATTATAGKILQLLSATKTDTQSISANATPSDIVGLSITITPASSSSKFYITGKVQYAVQYGTTHQLHINVNGTEVGLGDADGVRPRAHGGNGYLSTGQQYANYSVAVDFLVNASDGNAHTIKLQGSNPDTNGSGTLHINRTQTDGNGAANPRYVSTLTVMEVGA